MLAWEGRGVDLCKSKQDGTMMATIMLCRCSDGDAGAGEHADNDELAAKMAIVVCSTFIFS